MTKRFPSTVRFRLRRHPNRVHLTRSNVIRRNTAVPSPSSPLLSLVLGATLANSAPKSRTLLPPLVGHVRFNQQPSLRCPPSETELRHGRTELASCTMLARGAPCWSWWMLSRVSASRNTCPRGVQQCHPPRPNRILSFHRLLPDRNFPPSKFSNFPPQTIPRWRFHPLPLVSR